MDPVIYPVNQEWHSAINRHQDDQRAAGKKWTEARFMYDGLKMAQELPRMVVLFKQEREG